MITGSFRRGAATRRFRRGIFNEFDLPTTLYAGYLAAGIFKYDDRLSFVPIDLTILLAAWLGLLLIIKHRELRMSRDVNMLFLLFATFALPLFWSDLVESDKVVGIFTFTLIAVFAPFAFIRTETQVRRFFNALLLMGVVMAVDATVVALGSDLFRIGGFGSNPIWSGRLAGACLVILFSAFLYYRVRLLPLLVLASVLGITLAASGSRGPLLATVAAVLTILALLAKRAPRQARNAISIAPLMLALVAVTALAVPKESLERFAELDVSSESESRFQLYETTLPAILENPAGIGWARFDEIAPWEDAGYTHNLLLEIPLEAGWISGIAFFYVLGTTTLRLQRAPLSEESMALMALYVFFIVASLFSGDINANRYVFAMIGIALATYGTNGVVFRGNQWNRPDAGP